MCTYFLPHFLHKVHPIRLTGGLFECEGIITFLCVVIQRSLKLGILYGEELDIYTWWRSLDAKLAVSIRMELVTDMATYAKREMMFCMSFPLLYFFNSFALP